MTGVFLQARTRSLRLPRKVLLPLGNTSVLQMAMRALRQVRAELYALLCDADSVAAFYPLASHEGFRVVVGSSTDVLDRFILAARSFELDILVRATADNPFVSAKLANMLLEDPRMHDADYAGYLGNPVGTGVERIKVSALEQAHARAEDAYEREHVCPYLYRHPQNFRIATHPAPGIYLCDDSVTLDTAEDYEKLTRIIDRRKASNTQSPLEIDELISLLRQDPR